MSEPEPLDSAASRDARVERLIEPSPAVPYTAKAAGDFGVTFVGKGIQAQLGYSPSQFTEDPGFWRNHIHPDDRDRVLAEMARLFENEDHRHEYRFLHADGSWRWICDELALIRDDHGNPAEIVGSRRDITERRRSESELKENAARYRNLVENTADWIWETNAQGKYTYSNRRMETILGYPADEFSELDYTACMDAEDAEDFAALLESQITEKTGWQGCVRRFVDRSGEYRYLESNAEAILDAAGELSAFRGVDRDITARIEADDQLRRSIERYELAVRGTHDGLWDWNIASGQDYFSPRWKEILGYRENELDPHVETFTELLHPDDRQRAWDAVDAHLKHKLPYDIEFQMRHKSGRYIWVHAKGQAIWNEAGEPVRMAGSIADITDRKEAARQLVRSEQRMNEAQRIAKIGNWERDILNNEAWWSKELYSMLQVNPETRIASFDVFLERVHPDERERVREYTEQALIKEGRHSFEVRAVLPDGTEKFLQSQGEVSFDENRRPIRMFGTLQDITERKQMESQINNLMLRLEAITQVAFDGIVISENGIVSEGTEHFARKLGYQSEDVIGRPVTEFVAPQFVSLVRKKMQTPIIEPFQMQLLRQDGSMFPVEACGTTITIDGKNIRISAFKDISAKAELEREIVAISERERRRIGRELHDGVGQLLFAASLSLRTIAQHLEKNSSPECERLRDVQEILDQSIDATRRVSHLLAPVVYGGEGLSSALTRMVANIDANSSAKCTATCTFDGDFRNAETATHLYRIAQESVNNALKHSQAKNIQLSLYPDGDLLHLEVLDDGIGIPSEEQAEPSGMGLRSLQYRARMIDGNLEIERRGERGTCVRCSCPA